MPWKQKSENKKEWIWTDCCNEMRAKLCDHRGFRMNNEFGFIKHHWGDITGFSFCPYCGANLRAGVENG